nr:hypothetical protein [uncultured Blautia sp.]
MEEEYIAQHRRGNSVLYGAGADHIWLGRNMRKTENEKLRQDTITVSCFLIAAVIYENAVDQISRRRIVCKGAISREKKRAVVKMSASARDAQMYFLVPGKYRENMLGSEESVIVTEQRYPLLVCESDCTGLKASA